MGVPGVRGPYSPICAPRPFLRPKRRCSRRNPNADGVDVFMTHSFSRIADSLKALRTHRRVQAGLSPSLGHASELTGRGGVHSKRAIRVSNQPAHGAFCGLRAVSRPVSAVLPVRDLVCNLDGYRGCAEFVSRVRRSFEVIPALSVEERKQPFRALITTATAENTSIAGWKGPGPPRRVR